MTHQHDSTIQAATPETTDGRRRPYLKPAFTSESVFETMALVCGKQRGTQGDCTQLVKNS